jgi:ligand-binding sensor domain-containing protein
MKTLATLLSPLYLLTWLFTLSLITPTHAADLTFTPATPLVEINKTITLSVQGAVGTVKWTTIEGTIQDDGLQVTYLAPAQASLDIVSVLDSEGNFASVKVVITLPQTFSLENAHWEVFTNRSQINALSRSEDGKTLWVGTTGGLEKRDAQTGEVQQVFLKTDGLPDNHITAITPDSQGGLWVGTKNGLAHYVQGQWLMFNTGNSGLPYNWVNVLLSDSQGGLWVGTYNGLAHYYAQGQWQVFNTDNSGLPFNDVSALLSDSQGGLWVGTNFSGLAHYVQGQWQVFNANNSGLPSDGVSALLADSQGGLWVGTVFGGLAHYAQGQWQVFNQDNSGLPDNNVNALLADSQGGLWVGTGNGLVHYIQEQWQVFNTSNSGLPGNGVFALLPDSQGGLWIGAGGLLAGGGLAHLSAQGQWQVFNTDNSGLPSNNISAFLPDNQGGVWVGTNKGLAHYAQGPWQVFNTDNSGLPNNDIQALLPDSQGGLWVGIGCKWNDDYDYWTSTGLAQCVGGGLAHYTQGQWQLFNRNNSGLPSNNVRALLLDSQGGLWVGTASAGWDEKQEIVIGGLAYWNAQGQWQVFNTDNSGLYYDIKSLLHDSQDGLWVVSYWGQFAHYAQGQWQVFNADIPGTSTSVGVILPDSQDGMWVGSGFGLAHYVQGQGQAFNTDNSGLPDNNVDALLLDG